jgi:hypothetical protein
MEDGMNLTNTEARHLARLLIARLAHDADWLLWENLPELGEHAFERLQAVVVMESIRMLEDSKLYDRLNNVDAMYLLEQARGVTNRLEGTDEVVLRHH